MPRVRASWTAAAALIALAACGGSSGGTEPQQNGGGGGGGGGAGPVTVTVGNNNYSPSNVSVRPGGSVMWQWDSCTGVYGEEVCTEHSVTFDDGGPSAPAKDAGTFSRSFPSAGTFTYYCTSHGRTAMSGRVVVQ